MKAAVLHKGARELSIEEVKDPERKKGEVRVQVEACGLCGSDLHITIHPIIKLKEFPRIPGHEAAGTVLECDEESELRPGQRVVISAGTSCGHCSACLAGKENLCPEVGVLGFDRDGAFAEQIVVRESNVFALPDSIHIHQGAILADAVSTPYHALKYTGEFEPGQAVAIAGCGGLGIQAVLLAKAMGASRVIGIDIDSGALENAKRAGADEVYDGSDMRGVIRDIQKAGSIDIVCDYSGVFANADLLLRTLRPAGRMVLVGLGRGEMRIGLPTVAIYRSLSIRGSYGSDRRALPELIDLVAEGRLDLSSSISGAFGLESLNQCIHDLYHRRGNPVRFIIEPQRML